MANKIKKIEKFLINLFLYLEWNIYSININAEKNIKGSLSPFKCVVNLTFPKLKINVKLETNININNNFWGVDKVTL